MYIPDCFRNLGHTSKRTQMSQIWCDPDVPEFAQPPKHGMHLDSKKEIRILPICAHSAHHHWQLFRYMGQCMRAADKKKQKKNSDVGKTTVLMGIIVDAFIEKYLQMHGSRHIIYTRAYSCIHSSRRLSYRVWHDGNMSANRMYFLFSHW